MSALTYDAHRQRHVALHQALDELLADFIRATPGPPWLQRPIEDLLRWSYRQTQAPDRRPGDARPTEEETPHA
jgi:hypothetical protein